MKNATKWANDTQLKKGPDFTTFIALLLLRCPNIAKHRCLLSFEKV